MLQAMMQPRSLSCIYLDWAVRRKEGGTPDGTGPRLGDLEGEHAADETRCRIHVGPDREDTTATKEMLSSAQLSSVPRGVSMDR